jgi:DNA-directed RNA polymerase sigma subunit (sigma70/sigma32)
MELDIFVGTQQDQVRQWLGDYPRAAARDLLCALSYNPRRVIELRYGLADGHRYSVEEIARIFCKSTSWVEEIECGAITMLTEFLFPGNGCPPS